MSLLDEHKARDRGGLLNLSDLSDTLSNQSLLSGDRVSRPREGLRRRLQIFSRTLTYRSLIKK